MGSSRYAYPSVDNTLDEVILINLLKVFLILLKLIEDIWRICKHGARIVEVRYYSFQEHVTIQLTRASLRRIVLIILQSLGRCHRRILTSLHQRDFEYVLWSLTNERDSMLCS